MKEKVIYDKVISFFDFNYQKYDKHMQESGHYLAQEKLLRLLLKEVREPILDLACDTGFILSLLSEQFVNLFANDLSIKMLNFTKKKLNLKLINYSNDNVESLNSYSQKFSTIICCNLFHYIEDHNKAITRWKQLLDNDGKIILIEEYPFILRENLRQLTKVINPKTIEEISRIMKMNHLMLSRTEEMPIDSRHYL